MGGRAGDQREQPGRWKKKQIVSVGAVMGGLETPGLQCCLHLKDPSTFKTSTQHHHAAVFANLALLSWHLKTRSMYVLTLRAVNMQRFYRVLMKDGLSLSRSVLRHGG